MAEARFQPPEVGAVIAAGGLSRRMAGVDKLLARIAGKPLLAHTVAAFEACHAIGRIILVLSRENLEAGQSLAAALGWRKVGAICPEGPQRRDSVWAALQRLETCQWVVIHDGARPCVTHELVERGLAAAQETGAAIAAVPVTDTIKVVDSEVVLATPERERLWAAQTPQVFRYDIIMAAHQQITGEAPDDAALVERLGHRVRVFLGSYDNIKVTTQEDLVLAQAILEARGC